MPREDGQFKKGQSGNPSGSRKRITFRIALRAELSKPSKENPSETVYEEWARKLVAEAKDGDAKMDVMKFLEAASPPDKGMSVDNLENPESSDADGNTVEP